MAVNRVFPRRQEDPLIQQLLERARQEYAQSSAIGSPSMYQAAAGGGIGPVAGVLTAQLGPIKVTPSLIRFRPKVRGGPINCKLYNATSVHIKVSCLALKPPTISDPAEHLRDPAVFVDLGSHSAAFS